MPVDNLPGSLEALLKQLMMENDVPSWHVQGGHFQTQVTIRFKGGRVADMGLESIIY